MAITRHVSWKNNGPIAWSTIGAVSGDLVLVHFQTRDEDPQVIPTGITGFTNIAAGIVDLSVESAYLTCYKEATGSESGNVFDDTDDLGLTAGFNYAVHMFHVPADEWVSSVTPESAELIALGTNPDCPALVPSWGSSEASLFFITLGAGGTYFAGPAPTNYVTNFATTRSTGAGSFASEVSSSWRVATVASEDPGVITTAVSRGYRVATIAFQGVEEGTISAAGVGVAVVEKHLSRTIEGTAVGVSRLSLLLQHLVEATAAIVAVVSQVTIFKRLLEASATAVGVLTYVREVMLAAIASGTASTIISKINKVLSGVVSVVSRFRFTAFFDKIGVPTAFKDKQE